jgi:two-component system response regulator
MQIRPILLVEDNPDDAELIKHAFTRSHLANELVVTGDGQQALDYLFCTGAYAGRSLDDMPGLILLDMRLPGMDGLEVLNRIRTDERTKFLPVVVLTSSEDETQISNSYKLGVNSYVLKPVDSEKFFKVVQQLGLYWSILNELPTEAVRIPDEQTAESSDS